MGKVVSRLLRVFHIGVFLGLDSMCRLIPAGRRNVTLVVRLDAIGDFFLWLQSGALDISRYARNSGRRAVLVANRSWADYARQIGLWDDVIGVDTRRLMWSPVYRLRVFGRIRALGAEVLIQPRPARVFLQEDALARVSGAELRIGSAGTLLNLTPRQRSFGNRYYDRLIGVDETWGIHESVRNHQFVLALTGGPSTPFPLASDPGGRPNDAVVVVLGAGDPGRVWPLEKLAKLVRHIRDRHPSLSILLLGVSADRALAKSLEEVAGIDLENRVGEATFQQYVDAIAGSRLVICNDSSAYHIAMALGKSVLCFFGGGHPGWFVPYPANGRYSNRAVAVNVPMDCYGCNWNCRYPRAAGGAFRCVEAISTDVAIASSESLLST